MVYFGRNTAMLDFLYDYLVRHIVPGPQSLSYFVPHILIPVALLIPRTALSRWQSAGIFLPVIVLSTIHAWLAMGGVDVISVNALLGAILFLALKDPSTQFKRILRTEPKVTIPVQPDASHGTSGEQSALLDSAGTVSSTRTAGKAADYRIQPYPSTMLDRLQWVGMLLVSIRLNDWLISSPSHDRTQPPAPAFITRRAFLAQAILSFVRGFLTLDLTHAYIMHDPYFTYSDASYTSSLPFGSVQGLLAAAFRSLIIGAQAWAILSQLFYLFATLPVLLNATGLLADIWSPHTWAPYYGPASAIFTHGVRGFWGRYWHQTMRQTVSGPGYAVADLLKLSARGFARYAVVSSIAFLLSGTVHMGLVPPEPLHATVAPNKIRLYIGAFFWVQPIAMLMEVIVVRTLASTAGSEMGQRGGRFGVRLVLTGVWVLAWFGLCLPLVGEVGKQLGWWRVWPLPVSLWRGLRGEGWVTWPFLLR